MMDVKSKTNLPVEAVVFAYVVQRKGANLIAKEYGCQQSTVYRLLKRLGVPMRSSKEIHSERHAAARRARVAEEVDLIAPSYDGFLVEHRERARWLRGRGVTIREIAGLLGRPITTVHGWTRDIKRPPVDAVETVDGVTKERMAA